MIAFGEKSLTLNGLERLSSQLAHALHASGTKLSARSTAKSLPSVCQRSRPVATTTFEGCRGCIDASIMTVVQPGRRMHCSSEIGGCTGRFERLEHALS
ncbi:hypothetical protein [Variovorax rhizosphaerae]|uniref:Uncharacterized protein n=1 Tax=Variovorax rhizosphaerae TaxID=1836200 RepID=A0ABU8WIR2_9BURK